MRPISVSGLDAGICMFKRCTPSGNALQKMLKIGRHFYEAPTDPTFIHTCLKGWNCLCDKVSATKWNAFNKYDYYFLLKKLFSNLTLCRSSRKIGLMLLWVYTKIQPVFWVQLRKKSETWNILKCWDATLGAGAANMAGSHASVPQCSVAACVGDEFELMWSERMKNPNPNLSQ